MSATGCAKSPSLLATSPVPSFAPGDAKLDLPASTPFAGVWTSCAGTDAAEQCSRDLLLQHGKRICGTWSYFASGDSYDGRVIAEVMSPLEARRKRVCGRPGSEARTECDTGWEAIDQPLRLCSGKLGDLDGNDGGCFADYERAEDKGRSLQELASQSWVQACLSHKEERLQGGLKPALASGSIRRQSRMHHGDMPFLQLAVSPRRACARPTVLQRGCNAPCG